MMDDAPLFGGYLFTQLVDREIIERSRSMSLPEFNEVHDSVIEYLRGISWDQVTQEADPLKPGNAVIINSGPFKWHDAIVKAKRGDRITVLMQIMSTEQEIEFSSHEVVAA